MRANRANLNNRGLTPSFGSGMDERQRGPFFRELHAFRGIAILSIVMAHAAGTYSVFSGSKPAASAQDLVSLVHFAAWHDSTLWFALISGLLFPTVFARRGFAAFYRNRLLRVVLPYVLMTALFTPVGYRPAAPDEFLRWKVAGLGGYLNQFGDNLLHGTALHPYWYIPVLVCLYVLTPPSGPWPAGPPLPCSSSLTQADQDRVLAALDAWRGDTVLAA